MSKKNKSYRQYKGKIKGKARNSHRMIYATIAIIIIIIVCVAWFWKHPFNTTTEIKASIEQPASQDILADNLPVETTSGGPVIHFPDPSHDFGTISQGDKVTHTFVVQNRGDKPLKLIKAKGS